LLTPLECGVLGVLMKAEGALLRHDQLMNEVWGEKQYAVGSNVLEVVILSLRKKLGPQAKAVATVRGLGYRFCDLPDARS
jgi:DNA-binding response OmpR family regulator